MQTLHRMDERALGENKADLLMLRRWSSGRLWGLVVVLCLIGVLTAIAMVRSGGETDQAALVEGDCPDDAADNCEPPGATISTASTTTIVPVSSTQAPSVSVPSSMVIEQSIFRFVADADCSIAGVVETTHCQPENEGAHLVDLDFDTRWSAQNDAVVRLDLAAEEHVIDAGIAWYHGDERSATFAVAVSSDGLNWTPIGDRQSTSGTTTDFQRVPIDMDARYVAIAAYGNSDEDGSWNSITEIDINTSFDGVSSS